VNTLVRLMRSEDVRVRLVAVLVTGDYLDCFKPCEYDAPADRPPMPADLPDVLNAARADPHAVVAALATCAAGQLNHRAVPLASVLELLWDARPAIREAALRALARMDGGAACGDAIAPLLADPAASVRLAAVETVRLLAGPALSSPAVRTCLLPLLDNADGEVRQGAIWAAEALGPAMTEAMVVRLTAMTAEEGVFIRTYSIQALAAAGQLAHRPSVLAALLACFEEPNVFEHAWEAYADLAGPTDPELVRRVTAERDQTTSKWKRQKAIDFLARIGAS
jgi:HEAT repeat protein